MPDPQEHVPAAPVARRSDRVMSAYNQILDKIVSLQLEPGARITEARLAEDTGLGSRPVREALLMLSAANLVHVQHGKGYYVTPLSLDQARDHYAFRQLLEGEAAARAAAATVQPKELLRGLADYVEHEAPTNDHDVWVRNRTLHISLVSFSGSHELLRAVHGVLLRTERLSRLAMSLTGDRDPDLSGHQVLAEAVIAGDVEAARSAAMKHVATSGDFVLAAVEDERSGLS